jgi:hypothetical protein
MCKNTLPICKSRYINATFLVIRCYFFRLRFRWSYVTVSNYSSSKCKPNLNWPKLCGLIPNPLLGCLECHRKLDIYRHWNVRQSELRHRDAVRLQKGHVWRQRRLFSGEANVYTLGDVGQHRVVTTKLPMTGNSRDAVIATGSTTTRLLGTFQVRRTWSIWYVIMGIFPRLSFYFIKNK